MGKIRGLFNKILYRFCNFFLIASVGFWQLGKTDIAKAYIIPTLVAGVLLMTIGLGLFFTNKSRVVQFEKAYHANATAFYESEMERNEATLKEYQNVVFKGIPVIMILASLGILFLHSPTWRAICITTIAMLVVILLVDGTAHGRIKNYQEKLMQIKK